MKLSGWLFVLIGIVVAAVSWYMYNDGKKMGLFILVGVAMVVFGFIRVYIDANGPSEKKREELAKELPSNNPRTYTLASIPRVCGMCGTKNNPRASFCGHCGHRL